MAKVSSVDANQKLVAQARKNTEKHSAKKSGWSFPSFFSRGGVRKRLLEGVEIIDSTNVDAVYDADEEEDTKSQGSSNASQSLNPSSTPQTSGDDTSEDAFSHAGADHGQKSSWFSFWPFSKKNKVKILPAGNPLATGSIEMTTVVSRPIPQAASQSAASQRQSRPIQAWSSQDSDSEVVVPVRIEGQRPNSSGGFLSKISATAKAFKNLFSKNSKDQKSANSQEVDDDLDANGDDDVVSLVASDSLSPRRGSVASIESDDGSELETEAKNHTAVTAAPPALPVVAPPVLPPVSSPVATSPSPRRSSTSTTTPSSSAPEQTTSTTGSEEVNKTSESDFLKSVKVHNESINKEFVALREKLVEELKRKLPATSIRPHDHTRLCGGRGSRRDVWVGVF